MRPRAFPRGWQATVLTTGVALVSWLASPAVPSPLPSSPPPVDMNALTWSADIQQRLHRFLQNTRGGAAVFDADGTLWADDVGEAFLRWLIAERKLLNVDYHRDIYAEYEARVKEDKAKGYAWAVTIMAGLREAEVKRWADAFFRQFFLSRIYGPQKDLIARLQKNGTQVWIVSASNRWIIQAGAPHVGVDPGQAIGIDLEVEKGLLTDRLKLPVTYRAGKVEAIKTFIGRQPLLACGDSGGDRDMLEYSSSLALLITHQADPRGELIDQARQAGWLLQYFPLLDPWQAQQPSPP